MRGTSKSLKGGAGLWIDALAGGEREAEYAALRRGDVELRKLQTLGWRRGGQGCRRH